MPTMDTVANNVHFSLFKGEPGTRKSTAALSYPRPQYWFSWDQKMNALTIPMRKWGIDPKEITYDSYTDWNSAKIKLEKFRVDCPYKTIVIDSITSCADYMLRQVRISKSGGTTKSGSPSGKTIGGIPVSEIEDFNAEASGLTELIALTKDIQTFHKIDVILIAHVIRKDEKSLDGRINVSRTIVTAGKGPAAKIPAYCDETYHFSVERSVDADKGGDYIVLTSHVGEDFARTTLPLPAKLTMGDKSLYEEFIKPAINSQITNK
jgi:hypothetical protein